MSDYLIVGGIGLLIAWTGTVAGFAMWLNAKFNGLMPTDDYSARHEMLETRLRAAEIKLARVCERLKLPAPQQ